MGFDLLIRNGTVVDGSGAPRVQADAVSYTHLTLPTKA